jgi:hypothetical protein
MSELSKVTIASSSDTPPEPDWVTRARIVFANYGADYYAGGNAVPDAKDRDYWLRCFKIGQAARRLSLTPARYLEVAEDRLAQLEACGIQLVDREHFLDENTGVLFTRTAAVGGARNLEHVVDTGMRRAALQGMAVALRRFKRWEVTACGDGLVLAGKVAQGQYVFSPMRGAILVNVSPLLLDRDENLDRVADERRQVTLMEEVAGSPH